MFEIFSLVESGGSDRKDDPNGENSRLEEGGGAQTPVPEENLDDLQTEQPGNSMKFF